jgi:hypothetical protein
MSEVGSPMPFVHDKQSDIEAIQEEAGLIFEKA